MEEVVSSVVGGQSNVKMLSSRKFNELRSRTKMTVISVLLCFFPFPLTSPSELILLKDFTHQWSGLRMFWCVIPYLKNETWTVLFSCIFSFSSVDVTAQRFYCQHQLEMYCFRSSWQLMCIPSSAYPPWKSCTKGAVLDCLGRGGVLKLFS